MDPVPGFRFAATRAGLKDDRLDLGAIVADRPAVAAAVCTQNRLRAPPVDVTEARVRDGRLQAVLVNSGNANAATGEAGRSAAVVTTAALASRLAVPETAIAPVSTGVIGVPLPVDKIVNALDGLVAGLRPDAVEAFAQAILTTDKGPKAARRRVQLPDRSASILVVAKGAGMIHPQMATTLAFVITDVPCDAAFLRVALRSATDLTFNRITVDGDTSTNDCIIALSADAPGRPRFAEGDPSSREFVARLTEALEDVAVMVVADGEGAQHAVRIVVQAAASDAAAQRVASTIATSNLVKTALYGQDPNWGRILAAAGRSGVAFDPARATIHIGDAPVYRRGQPMTAAQEAAAAAVMRRPRYDITVTLGGGDGRGWYWTCDLGHDYVKINADYRT